MYILVLEASTTSAKAMLYDTSDGSFEVKVRAYTGNYEDVTIHKAENVYQQMMALGSELAEGKEIGMISLGGTWHSLMLCDKNMEPATPVYLWSYTGAAEVCKELRQDPDYVKNYYNKTGCMVNAIYPFFKLLLLKKRGYDLKDYYVMGQGTYNNYRMTGRRVITECLASGTGLLNTHTKKYDPEILAAAGITEAQLSEVVDYTHTYPLTEDAAKLLGVKAGIPVVPTSSDGGLNQVGVGAVAEGVMTFSVGTSGAIRLTTPKPILPEEPSTWCYMSPKAWLSGAATNGCCNCIDWFKDRMFGPDVSYGDIERGIEDRTTTPVFLPFLFGERCPGWNDERTGGFLEVRPYHKPNDLYRAVQEGVLFNLYHCYKMLTKVNGVPKRIKFSGGILHSEEWTQMCADIFQTDLEVDNNEHGSLLGGAVLAMELAGVITDVRDFDPAPAKIIHPNPEKAKFYEKKFERYLRCYESGC
ncbi:MAG: FGGY family carbohydrate kinase [Lachnospiraceae bacterium]|nr:FGGY family carbohydrate kinase [Lachnospiraceae bacterium]